MKVKKWKNIILINLVICLTLLSGVIIVYSVNKNFSKQNNDVHAEEICFGSFHDLDIFESENY